ncbi:hypothetical protein MA16_Dca000807 [Dendrobium catenatum]|uniref:Uncharacterized protein n=1 Tax=Dendrobium catenatum TaxID=906689 RepID=A0A2I0WUX7_9ASPA|nr:hypothetical protein MA16_Dca000807 [Dendrobium catenatum]
MNDAESAEVLASFRFYVTAPTGSSKVAQIDRSSLVVKEKLSNNSILPHQDRKPRR